MKVAKRISLLAGLLAMLGLSGCQKPHMLDGPGMVYEPPWTAFTISQGDSFWFTVKGDGDLTWLTGRCRDAEGVYEETEGIELSAEDLWKLRWMDLHTLDNQGGSGDVILSLTLPNGEVVSKKASAELSLEIYELLLPYFKK